MNKRYIGCHSIGVIGARDANLVCEPAPPDAVIGACWPTASSGDGRGNQ